MTEEFKSPEEQAEQILDEALASVEPTREDDCPMGDNCAVHHRLDEEFLDDDAQYGRLVTYVGEFAVVTSDNPELESIGFLAKLFMGKLTEKDIPPAYETCVFRVGEGPLADIKELDIEGQRESIRLIKLHDDWSKLKEAHEFVVMGIREGLIDVSKSAYPKGK